MNKFNISIQKSIELLGILLSNIRLKLNEIRLSLILIYFHYGLLRVYQKISTAKISRFF